MNDGEERALADHLIKAFYGKARKEVKSIVARKNNVFVGHETLMDDKKFIQRQP